MPDLVNCMAKTVDRFKGALRTNETQVTAVILMTLLNGITLMGRTGETHLWLAITVMLFWPLLAIIFNLLDPIKAE